MEILQKHETTVPIYSILSGTLDFSFGCSGGYSWVRLP